MLIESRKKNKYFYDQKVKSTQWCHPVLYYILKLHHRGIDVEQWFRELPDASVLIDDYGPVPKPEIAYYYQKYKLLQDNGFFDPPDTEDNEHFLSGRLTPGQIKSSLANTRQLSLEVVDYCNLQCAYCTYGKFYTNYDRRENNKLSIRTAKNVLNYLLDFVNSPLNKSHDQVFYIGFYGGEPLLNFPFIREMTAYVRQLKAVHNRFRFNITTNGLLLEKYMDFLVEHDFNILVSLDGNEYNSSYRVFKDGTPAYAEIVRNIDAFRNKYPVYFKENVNFNAVVHNRNTMDDLYRYFKTQYNKVPTVSELNPSGIAPAMREEFRKTYANISTTLFQVEDYSLLEKDMFINLPNIKGVNTFLQHCSGFVFNDYNELLDAGNKAKEEKEHNPERTQVNPLKETARIPTGTCIPFSRKVFVTVKGKILPCERVGFQYGLGSADENTVNLDFEKIAHTYNSYFDRLKKQCCSCANSEACMQCIFYLDLDQPQPPCRGFLTKDEFSRYLSTQLSYLEKNPHNYLKILKEARFV